MMRRRAAFAAFIGLVVCVFYGIAVAKSAESRDNCNQLEIARFNRATILPRLRRLVKATTFFRYYRFRLCDDCVHDFPSPICGSPECACIECSEEDIPCDKSGKCYLRDIVQDDDCLSRGSQAANAQLNFDLFDDKDEHSIFSPWPREKRMNGSWLTRPQENGVDTYVDLTKNPERWTGYGPQQYSSDIWRAIYDENCFESSGSNEGNDMCEEETTFKKIISGFHASVSTHIASEFCEEVDPDSSHCLRFSSSADEFQRRVGAHPDRVDNLYFLYLFMLRAFSKASDALSAVDFDAGDVVEASRIRKSVVDLSRQIELATDAKSDLCYRMMSGRPFDETIFFSGTRASMRDDFRGTFRNISSIMNCVGCDKCKLWGKLQLEGISVAMKVLLDDADLSTLDLTRTEVVAFVNALHVFSKSVEIVSDFQNRAKLSERDFVSSSSSSDQIEEHEEAEEEEEEQSQGGPQAPSTALLLLLGTAAFFLFSRRPPSGRATRTTS